MYICLSHAFTDCHDIWSQRTQYKGWATDIYVRISSYFLSFQINDRRVGLFLCEVYCS